MSIASSKTATHTWRRYVKERTDLLAGYDSAADGEVLTSDGAGGTAWEAIPPATGHPVGSILLWPDDAVPTDHLECDGSLLSIKTYTDLFDVIERMYGDDGGTTFTAATDDTITATGHGRSNGDIIVMSSSGTLPAGLTAGTKYYIIEADTNTFKVSLTEGGSAVDITDTGTGTHTFFHQFQLPDTRGRFPRFFDNGAAVDPDRASRTDRGDGTTGDNVGTLQADQYKSHTHGYRAGSSSTGSNAATGGWAYTINTNASGGNETRPKNIYFMGVIKYQ